MGGRPFKKVYGARPRYFIIPPKGDRREVVPLAEDMRFRGCPDRARLVFGASAIAAVSSYPIVGWRYPSVLDTLHGGGFVVSYSWLALAVGFGRSTWRRFGLILTAARLRGWLWMSS